MEADLLASLPRDLAVQAEAVPVDALHVGRGVVGGDQAGCVPCAACRQSTGQYLRGLSGSQAMQT